MRGALFMTLLVLASVASTAQNIPDPVRQTLEKRAQSLSGRKTVWSLHWRKEHAIPPSQLAYVQRQTEQGWYNKYLQEALEHGMSRAEAEALARQEAQKVARDLVRPVQFHVPMEIEVHTGRVRVRGVEPLIGDDPAAQVTMEVLYERGYGISVPRSWTLRGRTYTSPVLDTRDPSVPLPPHVYVWKTDGHAASWRKSAPQLPITPELLSILTGFSPLEMYGGNWRVERSDSNSMVLAQTANLTDLGTCRVRLELDMTRGGAVAKAEVHHPTAGLLEQYEVTKWRQVEGVWLPEEVRDLRNSPIGADVRTWRLEKLEPAVEKPFAILTNHPVVDYRLLGNSPGVEEKERRAAEIVGYKWTGKLPSESELRQMVERKRSTGSPPGTGSSAWWRFGPPILLITAGLLWYWRLKVKKVS